MSATDSIVKQIERKLEYAESGLYHNPIQTKKLDPKKVLSPSQLKKWKILLKARQRWVEAEKEYLKALKPFQNHANSKFVLSSRQNGPELWETREMAEVRINGTRAQREKRAAALKKLRGELILASAAGNVPHALLKMAQKLGVL